MRSKILDGYGRNKYCVFEDGRVVALGRVSTRGHIVLDHVLHPHANSSGYLRVSMNLEGEQREYFIHRLVAECFVENPDNKKIVNHKDGDKHNNTASNLEWCTNGENNKHAFALGLKKPTVHYGRNNSNTKLSAEEVMWIRAMYTPGSLKYGQCAMARKFGVAQSSIWAIVNNRTHSYLGEDDAHVAE
jgi:hypothetical protein